MGPVPLETIQRLGITCNTHRKRKPLIPPLVRRHPGTRRQRCWRPAVPCSTPAAVTVYWTMSTITDIHFNNTTSMTTKMKRRRQQQQQLQIQHQLLLLCNVKVMTICIVPIHETSLRRSGIQHALSTDITVLPAHPAFYPQAE